MIPKRSIVVYLAGPYRAGHGRTVSENTAAASALAAELWAAGYTCLCPHANSAHMDGVVPDGEFLAGDIAMLRRCDMLALMDNWQESEGARREREVAEAAGIPIFRALDLVRLAEEAPPCRTK